MLKRFTALLIVLACLVAISGSVFAAHWVFVDDTSDGNFYIDYDNFRYYRHYGHIDKNTVEIWTKWEYSSDMKRRTIEAVKKDGLYNDKWENVSFVMMLSRYKLDSRQTATIYYITYDNNGHILLDWHPEVKYDPIVPNSNDDKILKCIEIAIKNNLVK
jgi:hypothetical protein